MSWVELAEKAISELSSIDEAREKVLTEKRPLVRSAREAIFLCLEGKYSEAEEKVRSILISLKELRDHISPFADVLSGYLDDVSQEVCEASFLLLFLDGRRVIEDCLLICSPKALLLGLADAALELRRVILSYLLKNDFSRASSLFEVMKQIYRVLFPLPFPTSLIPLKPKVDALRAAMDKCASEIILSKRVNLISDASGPGGT